MRISGLIRDSLVNECLILNLMQKNVLTKSKRQILLRSKISLYVANVNAVLINECFLWSLQIKRIYTISNMYDIKLASIVNNFILSLSEYEFIVLKTL